MSGVIKYAAIAVGVIATAGVGAGLAAGFSLATSVAGMVGATAGVLGVSSGLIAGVLLSAAAIDLTMIADAIFPKETQGGQQTRWKADPYAGIPYVMGRTLTSGNIVARMVRGQNNMFEGFTTVLSLGPIQGYETTFMNKTTMTWSHDPEIYPDIAAATNAYSGYIWEHRTRGLCPAPIAPGATEAYANWGPDHKLSGLAAVHNTFCTNSKAKDNLAGEPQPAWIIEGVLVYDPRQDSTYPGGSGPCRALDETTYVYSENPHLHGLTWLLGRWQNGIRVAGIGAPVSAIDMAPFVDGANLDDARGWKVGGQIYTRPDTPWNSMKAIMQAGGAQPVLIGGRYSCINRAPRVSLATITRNDIVGKCTLAATQSRRTRINGIVPVYRSEEHDWEMVPGAGVLVSAYIAMDGDERTKEISYPLVQNVTHASQLALYDICDAREIGPGSVPLGPAWLNYRLGDCVTFAPEDGFSLKTLITGRGIDAQTGAISYTLRGETDGKHAFALGQTGVAPAIAQYSYNPDIIIPTLDWSVQGTQLEANGESLAALIATGACSDPNADAVVFDYRPYVVDQDLEIGWIGASFEAPSVTRKEITGVTSGTKYQVGVRYRMRGVIGARAIYGPVIAGTSAPAGWLQTLVAGSYTDPSSDLLTAQQANDSTCMISIVDHDRIYTDRRVHISNVPPITGLLFSTTYYVYYEDADRVGGAVTAFAATTGTDALPSLDHPARTNLGSITTPGKGELATNGGGIRAASVFLDRMDVEIQKVQSDIAALELTYGSTESAAESALNSSNSASAAQTASTAAQTARDQATDAKTAAQVAETSASGSASGAANSASMAAGSETAAGQSASSAHESATSAQTAAGQASTSAGQAATSANDADGSKTAAGSYASQAAQSASDAGGSANAASSSASSAASSSSSAGSSATAAQGSESNAQGYAGQAATSASAAQGFASSASGSASSAASSASLAAAFTAGGNSLSNTDFPNRSLAGWDAGASSGAMSYEVGVNLPDDTWHPQGENVITLHQLGSVNDQNQLLYANQGIVAQAGQWYQAYSWVAAHRCQVDAFLVFLDSAGNWLEVHGQFQQTVATGGTNPNNWTQLGAPAAQAPTGTVAALISLRKRDTLPGEGDSWAWFWRPYVGAAKSGQTAFNPYTAGSAGAQLTAVQAAINSESSARASQDAAFASQVNSISATVQSQGNSLGALSASVSNNASAVATLQSQAASFALQLTAGNPNLAPNSSGEMGMSYWDGISGSWSTDVTLWGSRFFCSPSADGNVNYYYLRSYPIRVEGGSVYTLACEAEMYQAASSDRAFRLEVVWYSDAAGTQEMRHDYGPTTGVTAAYANRAASVFSPQAPTGAASCRILMVGLGTYLYWVAFRRLKFELGGVATGYTQEATVLTQAGVITDLQGRTEAYLQNVVSAGGSRAAVRLFANGDSSGVELQANAVRLGAANKPALDTDSEGNVLIHGQLDVGSIVADRIVANGITYMQQAYSSQDWYGGAPSSGVVGYDEYGNPIYSSSDGSYRSLVAFSVYMDRPGDIMALAVAKQSYSGVNQSWQAEVRVDGNTVFRTGGIATSDSIALMGKLAVGGGTHNVEFLWWSTGSILQIRAGDATLTTMRRYA